jgi:hypothetical protein
VKPRPQDSPSVAGQRAFLNKYCVTCHSDKLRTAQLSLETVSLSDVTPSGEVLEKLVRKLATGAMPPASAPKPDKATARAFLTSLETTLDQAAAAHPKSWSPLQITHAARPKYLSRPPRRWRHSSWPGFGGEESPKGLDPSLFADPKQTGDAEIDLIDQCQILVPFGVLDFIDADGVDLAERPVFQTPGDDMFDRDENLVPGCAKCLRRLFP